MWASSSKSSRAELKYQAVVAAFYALIFLLIGYGLFTTPTYEPPSACLQRPWLDTSNGC